MHFCITWRAVISSLMAFQRSGLEPTLKPSVEPATSSASISGLRIGVCPGKCTNSTNMCAYRLSRYSKSLDSRLSVNHYVSLHCQFLYKPCRMTHWTVHVQTGPVLLVLTQPATVQPYAVPERLNHRKATCATSHYVLTTQ